MAGNYPAVDAVVGGGGAGVWFSSVVSCIANGGGAAKGASVIGGGGGGGVLDSLATSSLLGSVDVCGIVLAVVAVVGILLAMYNEDATPGSKRWGWITMELLPMAATLSCPTPSAAAGGGSRGAAVGGGGAADKSKAAEKFSSLLSTSTVDSLRSSSPTAATPTAANPFSVVFNQKIDGFHRHQQPSTHSINHKTITTTTTTNTGDGGDTKILKTKSTAKQKSISIKATQSPGRVVATIHEATTTTASLSTTTDNSAATNTPTNTPTNAPTNAPRNVCNSAAAAQHPPPSSSSPSSQCCWSQCGSSSHCIHHYHQLSYYRSDASVLCRVRGWWTGLVASARQFDSYTAMVSAGACSSMKSVRTVYRKAQLIVHVILLKYVVSESKRQFFYMLEKKLLKLPIDWEESEIASYLHVKRHLQSKDMWPFMWTVSQINSDDNKITVEGKRAYVMSSYSYLDLLRHPEVQQGAINTARNWATGTHGPRMLGGNSTILRDVERSVAKFFGRDDAMVLSGGFLACMSAICAVCKQGDLIIGDNRVHASLRTGLKLCGARVMFFKHNDYNHLSKVLLKHRKKYRSCWIVIESVYSMDGDTADLAACVDLTTKHDCKIILDEAHGLGVVGATGRGLEEMYGLPGVCTMIVGTFSKSIATVGGYITGSQDLIDFMDFHAPGNVFSAPLAAYCAGAALRSFEIIDRESWRVTKAQANAKFLRDALATGLGFWPENYPQHFKYRLEGDNNSTVIPVVFKDDIDRVVRIASNLLRKGWMVAAVAFPACPLRGPRFRITATCAYSEDIMRDFVRTLVTVCLEEQPNPMGVEDFPI
eukprot:GHVS01035925.1.p1 GENE.GHVS01035925.1~~GHVS01035925.1.p1  ORF type:complete len:821 (+),score=212.20 GHVS01035925.1:108-2570(+)